MINHARTLLLNIDGSDYIHADAPGDEIIPATYKVVTEPSYEVTIRRELFGTTPDRAMLNYRARQYMAILHSTELVDFVTALDNRVTYDFDDTLLFDNTIFDPNECVTIVSGTPTINFYGTPTPPDRTGLMTHTLMLNVVDANTISVERYSNPLSIVNNTYTITNNISNIIALQGTGYNFTFNGTIGDSWLLRFFNRPQDSLSSIVNRLDLVGEDVILELFGIGSSHGSTEPFKTFYSLWTDHHVLHYRLGGLLLGLIYSKERLRTNV